MENEQLALCSPEQRIKLTSLLKRFVVPLLKGRIDWKVAPSDKIQQAVEICRDYSQKYITTRFPGADFRMAETEERTKLQQQSFAHMAMALCSEGETSQDLRHDSMSTAFDGLPSAVLEARHSAVQGHGGLVPPITPSATPRAAEQQPIMQPIIDARREDPLLSLTYQGETGRSVEPSHPPHSAEPAPTSSKLERTVGNTLADSLQTDNSLFTTPLSQEPVILFYTKTEKPRLIVSVPAIELAGESVPPTFLHYRHQSVVDWIKSRRPDLQNRFEWNRLCVDLGRLHNYQDGLSHVMNSDASAEQQPGEECTLGQPGMDTFGRLLNTALMTGTYRAFFTVKALESQAEDDDVAKEVAMDTKVEHRQGVGMQTGTDDGRGLGAAPYSGELGYQKKRRLSRPSPSPSPERDRRRLKKQGRPRRPPVETAAMKQRTTRH